MKNLDQAKLDHLAEITLNAAVGMTLSASIYLGDKLGIYKKMATGVPTTSLKLAEDMSLSERWIREWLFGQAAAGFIEYDKQNKTFLLTPEAVKIFVDETNAYFQAGSFTKIMSLPTILTALEDSFRTGLGFGFTISGSTGAKEIERTFAPWFRSTFLDTVIPTLSGIEDKLKKGIHVADIGCGSGVALIEMAKKFPNSKFHGYEISEPAISLAEENKQAADLNNVTFYNPNHKPLPEDNSYAFITAFDSLHDMTHPHHVINSIANSLCADGTFFLADLNTQNTFDENLTHNPFAKHMYSWSLLYCLPSSLSASDGAGLGACGLSETKLNDYLAATHLKIVKKHNFNNPFTAYYEIKASLTE